MGRIKHLGFSTHGSIAVMKKFLDYCGEHMEFCQIQLNYLDWTLQNAAAKVELLNSRNIPIWVMEPVRGGKLAKLSEENEAALRGLRADESTSAWAFRWLQSIPGVTVVLSGMSNMAQMQDNIKTFTAPKPLSQEETATLLRIAEQLKDSVPCTACRYCCDGCPVELNIPELLSIYNELRINPSFLVGMRVEGMPVEKQPQACLNCGQCSRMCPQHIDVPAALENMVEILKTVPRWMDICREREEAAKKL